MAIAGTTSIVEDVPATFQPAAQATGQVLLDSLLAPRSGSSSRCSR